MSGIHNDQLNFTYQRQSSVYGCKFVDQNGNQWSVDGVGVAEGVREFVKQKGLQCWAEPVPQREALGYAEPPAAELSVGKDEPSGEQPDELPPGLPALEVTCTLLSLAKPGPYRVIFETDPPLTRRINPFRQSFRLRPGDTTANVRCITHRGKVSMRLSGPGGTKPADTSGNVIMPAAPGDIWWVTVTWVSGKPAVFSLRGDFTVN